MNSEPMIEKIRSNEEYQNDIDEIRNNFLNKIINLIKEDRTVIFDDIQDIFENIIENYDELVFSE